MLIGIYKIENKNNGRVYIGSSKCVENRWKQHLSALQENNHHCMRLQSDYNKYGILDFNFEVLELCNLNNILEVEQSWIDSYDINTTYNSVKSSKHLNINKFKDIVMFPKNISGNYSSIQSLRLFLTVIELVRKNKSDCIEIYVSELSEKYGISSDLIYPTAPIMIEDVLNKKYNNHNMFDNVSYEKGLFSIQLTKEALRYILEDRNCTNLQIKYDILDKIKNKRTFTLLTSLYENNKYLEYDLESFKETVNAESYERYNNLNQKIISPIIKEFKQFGLSLKLDTKRHNSKITKLYFKLD